MKYPKQKQAGFSLIEVLFTVMFLSLIVFGMIRLQTSNLTLDNTQKNQLKAHFYAHQALEIVSGLTAADWSGCGDKCYLKKNGANYSLTGGTPETLDSGLFVRVLKRDTDDLAPNTYLFTAEVEWTDNTGLHSVLAKRMMF